MELFDKDGKFVIDLPQKDTIPSVQFVFTNGRGEPFKGHVNVGRIGWMKDQTLFVQLDIVT